MFRRLALFALIAACHQQPGASAPKAPGSREPVSLGQISREEWSFYEPVALTLHPAERGEGLAFPLADTELSEPLENIAQLRQEGLAMKPSAEQRFAMVYRTLLAKSAPIVVSADSLFFAAHLALSVAQDELERASLAGDLRTFLERTLGLLASDAKGASPDLTAAYRLARAVLAVAMQLLDDKAQPPPELATVVAAEVAQIKRHPGFARSPVFGFELDYGALAPEGAATEPGALSGPHLALAWLAAAPFALTSKSEVQESPVLTAQARTSTRAAVILAQYTNSTADPALVAAYTRLRQVLRFTLGPVDDLSLTDLLAAGEQAELPLADRKALRSAVTIDKLRHAAFERHTLAVYDGVFNLSAPTTAQSSLVGRSAASVRVFGSHASIDASVLSQLLFPRVGARTGEHPRAHQGLRTLPSSLDVLSWMGSAQARTQLVVEGDLGFEGFEAALARVERLHPREGGSRAHASLYDSWLDAVGSWVQPSVADLAEPSFERPRYAARRAELAACAWAIGRHDAEPFGRAESKRVDGHPALSRGTPEIYIEANPETYAKLLGLLRQASRGFSALGVLGADGKEALEAAARLLEIALEASVAVVEARPAPKELAALPWALANFEDRFASGATGHASLVADVHADANTGRVLEVGTGALRLMQLVLLKADGRSWVVAEGPVLSFRETLQESGNRLSDRTWRALLQAGKLPVRAPFLP